MSSKRGNKDRRRECGQQMIMEYYFVANSTYNDRDFQRRLRMNMRLFWKIFYAICAHDYFSSRDVMLQRKLDFQAYGISVLL